MAEISNYEIVRIERSERAVAMDLADRQGIVVGMAGGPSGMSYAVLVGERTYTLSRSDLVGTGEHVDRSVVYTGETTRVQPQRYETDDSPA